MYQIQSYLICVYSDGLLKVSSYCLYYFVTVALLLMSTVFLRVSTFPLLVNHSMEQEWKEESLQNGLKIKTTG